MLDTVYHQALFEVTGVARMSADLLGRVSLSSCSSVPTTHGRHI